MNVELVCNRNIKAYSILNLIPGTVKLTLIVIEILTGVLYKNKTGQGHKYMHQYKSLLLPFMVRLGDQTILFISRYHLHNFKHKTRPPVIHVCR